MIDRQVRALLLAPVLIAVLLALGDKSSSARPAPAASRADDARAPGHAEDGLSPAIYPPRRLAIAFDHRLHGVRLRVPCAECHEGAAKSTRAHDRLWPSPRRCDRCHDTDHSELGAVVRTRPTPLSECSACHLGYASEHGNRVQRSVVPAPNLVFNHAAHAARHIGCAQCHSDVLQAREPAQRDLPSMRVCVRCHMMPGPARGDARGECVTCHVADHGRMKTRFASGRLVPPRWLANAQHDAQWITRHARIAGLDGELCASCHSDRECSACHDGRVRDRRIHPNDWLSLHGVPAQQAPGDCRSCHRGQSFCITCHLRSGVAQAGPYSSVEQRGRFHPPRAVWSDRPRTRAHHARAAQRNLDSCVSCHLERDCLVCHATGGRGGVGFGPGGPGFGRSASPHSSNFRSNCRRWMRKNPRPCLACHTPEDPNLARCR